MNAMFRLAEMFVSIIEKNKKWFNEATSIVYLPRTRFGTEDSQGVAKRILEDDLCGCELRITFDILKQTKPCINT